MKPQDLVVALKLAAHGDVPTFGELGGALGLSPSQAHAAVGRLVRAGLVLRGTRRVHRAALLELLVHGVRYVFPPARGGTTSGLPTAHAGPPLSAKIVSSTPPPVWPDPEGSVRGEMFAPLHRSALVGSKTDSELYELLTLVDALRGGRARERRLAAVELRQRLVA